MSGLKFNTTGQLLFKDGVLVFDCGCCADLTTCNDCTDAVLTITATIAEATIEGVPSLVTLGSRPVVATQNIAIGSCYWNGESRDSPWMSSVFAGCWFPLNMYSLQAVEFQLVTVHDGVQVVCGGLTGSAPPVQPHSDIPAEAVLNCTSGIEEIITCPDIDTDVTWIHYSPYGTHPGHVHITGITIQKSA